MMEEKHWMTTEQAAEYLTLKPSTLNNDRSTRRLNIPFCRLGRRILYDRDALDQFVMKRLANSCSGEVA